MNVSKFKIGDRVKIVSAKADFKKKYIGNEFIIENLDGPYDKDLSSYYSLGVPATGGWRWRDSELELVEQKTKVTEFKAGDTVKVLKDRNAFGDDISWRELTGKLVTLKEIHDLGYPLHEKFDRNFVPWSIEEDTYWVRSDDIELISRATPEQTEIIDLKASNARLADANEAKRDRLNAIKEIVNADVEIVKKETTMDKYQALLGDYGNYTIRQYDEGATGYEIDINIDASDVFFDAESLRALAKHLKKLAKQMEKKEFETYR